MNVPLKTVNKVELAATELSATKECKTVKDGLKYNCAAAGVTSPPKVCTPVEGTPSSVARTPRAPKKKQALSGGMLPGLAYGWSLTSPRRSRKKLFTSAAAKQPAFDSDDSEGQDSVPGDGYQDVEMIDSKHTSSAAASVHHPGLLPKRKKLKRSFSAHSDGDKQGLCSQDVVALPDFTAQAFMTMSQTEEDERKD